MIFYYISRFMANMMISFLNPKRKKPKEHKSLFISTPWHKDDPIAMFTVDKCKEHEWRSTSPEEILEDMNRAIEAVREQKW